MKLIKHTTEKTYRLCEAGKDLSKKDARSWADNLLDMQGNSQDWFFAGCERVNYDTVDVIYVEDR